MKENNTKSIVLDYRVLQRLESATAQNEKLKVEAQERERSHERDKKILTEKLTREQEQRELAESKVIIAEKKIKNLAAQKFLKSTFISAAGGAIGSAVAVGLVASGFFIKKLDEKSTEYQERVENLNQTRIAPGSGMFAQVGVADTFVYENKKSLTGMTSLIWKNNAIAKLGLGSCVIAEGISESDKDWMRVQVRINGKVISGFMQAESLKTTEVGPALDCQASANSVSTAKEPSTVLINSTPSMQEIDALRNRYEGEITTLKSSHKVQVDALEGRMRELSQAWHQVGSLDAGVYGYVVPRDGVNIRQESSPTASALATLKFGSCVMVRQYYDDDKKWYQVEQIV